MSNGTQERLPDPKTFDPLVEERIPHREDQIPEILQWKLDVLIFFKARIKQCLDDVIDCLEDIKTLLAFILAALIMIGVILVLGFAAVIAQLNLITGILLLILFFILFIVIRLVIPIITQFFTPRRP